MARWPSLEIGKNIQLGVNMPRKKKETLVMEEEEKKIAESPVNSIEQLIGLVNSILDTTVEMKCDQEGFDKIREAVGLAVGGLLVCLNSISTIDETMRSVVDVILGPVPMEVVLTREGAQLPSYANDGDAGMDIYTPEDTKVEPYCTVMVPMGFKISIPMNVEVQIRPRSSVALKTSLIIPNSPGTIDYGYKDEVCVLLTNISDKVVLIPKGRKIAQMVMANARKAAIINVSSFTDTTDRGGGIGSTGD